MSRKWIYSALCLLSIGMIAVSLLPVDAGRRVVSDVGPAFDGVWVSRGYGWLWKIADGEVERFDISESFCIPRPSRRGFAVRSEHLPELSDEDRVLRLRMDDPDYFYTFDRVADVPARCQERPPVTPNAVLDAFAEAFEAHYAFFEERGIDWEQAVASARSKLHAGMGDRELFGVLAEIISLFRDGHVGLEAEIGDEDLDVAGSAGPAPAPSADDPATAGTWSARAAVASLDGARSRGDDTLVFGRLADDVGYLQVRSMSGMAPDELEAALDEAMASFEGLAAVVVDVSRNSGGYDSFARLIARRFAAEPTVAYSKHPGDYSAARPQELVLQPPDRPRYTGPVYLITSRRTASAAEIFVMSMRALPNVLHLGEATEGSLSDILSKRLPNGWKLSLSNEVYLDSEGVLWEGRGIRPEVPLALSENRRATREDERSVLDVVRYVRMHAAGEIFPCQG